MTVKEMYGEIGGDYEDVLIRLKNDERIIKYLGFFLRDGSFEKLGRHLAQKNVEAAFREAHNLKGVSANLAFSNLTKVSSAITEMLRDGKDFEGACESYPQLSAEYKKTVEGINMMLG